MALHSLPFALEGAGAHPGPVLRNFVAAAFGAPTAAFTNAVKATTAGGSHGVVGATDLAVAQQGTPTMGVKIGPGKAVVRFGNASSLTAGASTVFNDADTNVALSPADPTNPRIDLVCVEIRSATEYGQAEDKVRFVAVTGTPAASPTVPSLASYPNALVLAQVAVAAAASSITNANITDKRMWAVAKGGILSIPTFTDAPTGAALEENTWIYERDADRVRFYDGTGWVIMAEPVQSYNPTTTGVTLGTGGTTTGSYHRSDGYCDFECVTSFGSAGSPAMATGPTWTFPVTAQFSVAAVIQGTATFSDATGSLQSAQPVQITATQVEPRVITNTTGGALGQWSATVPVVTAVNDIVVIRGRIRMTNRYA